MISRLPPDPAIRHPLPLPPYPPEDEPTVIARPFAGIPPGRSVRTAPQLPRIASARMCAAFSEGALRGSKTIE